MTTPANASINYTTWRKGRHTQGDGTIGVCPKCGRKGAVRTMSAAPKPWNQSALLYVIHEKRVLGPSPFGGVIWDAFDKCIIRDVPTQEG